MRSALHEVGCGGEALALRKLRGRYESCAMTDPRSAGGYTIAEFEEGAVV
jgi:hypothetical protein